MNYYVISKERLIHHLDYDVRKSPIGLVNWFYKDGIINILLNVRGLNYLYREAINELSDLSIEISSALSKNNSILDIFEYKEEEPKEVVVPSLQEYLSQGGY